MKVYAVEYNSNIFESSYCVLDLYTNKKDAFQNMIRVKQQGFEEEREIMKSFKGWSYLFAQDWRIKEYKVI